MPKVLKIKIKRERKEELPNELYRNMMIIANGKASNIVIKKKKTGQAQKFKNIKKYIYNFEGYIGKIIFSYMG